jgi:heavy metal sensor kinase
LPDTKAQQRLAWVLLAAGGAVLALGLGGGWWLTARAIRPVEDISAAAMRISAGNLSERISTADPQNEFGRLAAVLNSTFARLESAFLQQKQFTADASHELRTPLAVLISEAQTTLARERTGAEYRETIEANLAAAQQMRQLTESLLTLARLEAGHEKVRREPFNLGELTQACVARIRPLVVARQITICSELAAAGGNGDEAQIRQVITNLLANAIHYNRDGGEVHVSTRVEGANAVLTVRDTGPGISAADLPHIFDRFYRADKARSRAEGHSGLGLAISKVIVDAHGGTIHADSQPGVGTTFTVRLPSTKC